MTTELASFLDNLIDDGFSVEDHEHSIMYFHDTKIAFIAINESYETNKERSVLVWKNITISFNPDPLDEFASSNGKDRQLQIIDFGKLFFSSFGKLDFENIEAGHIYIEPSDLCIHYSRVSFIKSLIQFYDATVHIFE